MSSYIGIIDAAILFFASCVAPDSVERVVLLVGGFIVLGIADIRRELRERL